MLQRAFKRSAESLANCMAKSRGASEIEFDILASFCIVTLYCCLRTRRSRASGPGPDRLFLVAPDPGRHGGALKAIYRQVQLPFFGPPLWLQVCTSTPPRANPA